MSLINGVRDALRKYTSLSAPRVLTTGLTQSEIATAEGDRYNSQRILSNFDSSTPVYMLFENPIDSGVIVALQKRILKTYSSGLIRFTVLWDYDVSTATKITVPSFNENNIYRGTKDAKFEASLLNPATTPDSGDWNVSGAATVIDDGIEREADFITTSGSGNNSSGGVSPDLGFRLYKPGTGFLIKAVSDADDNRISLGYDWIEVPISISGS